MAQARLWLWGLIPLAVLSLVASWWNVGAMEADISGRTAPILRSYGWGDSDYTVRGRDLTVTGPAYEFADASGTSQPSWIEEVGSTRGVRLVRDRLQPLPEGLPYAILASKQGDSLLLSGNVPRPQVRDDILAEIRKAGVTPQDRTTFAKGAPAEIGSAAGLVFGQLAALTDGSASVTGDKIAITGTAPDEKTSGAIRAALDRLPAGFTPGEINIDVPTVDFIAIKDAVSLTLTLRGVLPDEATRNALLDAAKERFEGLKVVDETALRGVATPSGFSTTALAALGSLARLTYGKLELHGSEIALSGTAPDANTSNALESALKALPAGFTLGALKIDVPSFDLTATKDAAAKTLTLSGIVPDEAAHRAILDASQRLFEGARVVDQTTNQALIAPPGFSVPVLVALRSLARLTDGKLTVTGSTIALSGKSADRNANDAIRGAFGDLPAGFKLGDLKIDGPSYEFTASKDPAAGTLTLQGLLPDESTRQSLLGAARNLFFRERVVDQTALDAKGAPNGFATTALEAIRVLSRLDAGKLTLGDGGVKLTGTTFYPRAADDIRTAFAALSGPLRGSAEILPTTAGAPVESAECQSLLNDLLGRGHILFETGSAQIDRASAGLLDSIVGTALRCPSSKFEIGGHTDSAGRVKSNIDLSQRRAEAVASYLEKAGIEQTKIEAVGYGSKKPIASNGTEEGKSRNRRIEILVK